LCAENNVEILEKQQGRMTMPEEEEKNALGEYLTKFSQTPKLNGLTACIIATKH
jgi:hypothetical protein